MPIHKENKVGIDTSLDEDGENKVLNIAISGRFDISMYSTFGECYKNYIGNVSKVVVDMSNLEYIDSSALGMLLMLRERTGGSNSNIELINLTPSVSKIFSTVKFDKLFVTRMGN